MQHFEAIREYFRAKSTTKVSIKLHKPSHLQTTLHESPYALRLDVRPALFLVFPMHLG